MQQAAKRIERLRLGAIQCVQPVIKGVIPPLWVGAVGDLGQTRFERIGKAMRACQPASLNNAATRR